MTKAEKQERARRVQEAFARLDKTSRALMWLHLVEDLTFREIGELAGKSEDAERMALHRARDRMKALLEQNHVSPP
jgi:RNA polymerase sigma-70 factor (ECF subfamily)